jgi:hypothetical protein
MNTKDTLNLENLSHQVPALTAAFGACLAEACAICLEEQGHQSGATLLVNGDLSGTFKLDWPAITEQMRRCWNDVEVTREPGAYAIACLLIHKLTPFTVIERSRKGTGIDYWLSLENDPQMRIAARLEVSGIGQGSARIIAQRVKIKLRQIERTNQIWPAFVIVVEFGGPIAQVVRKEKQ